MNRKKITSAADAQKYILAGNSIVTLNSLKTGQRFTFRVKAPKGRKDDPKAPRFVSLLRGPDNTADYTYIGTIFIDKTPQPFVLTKNSAVGSNAPSFKAFSYVWATIQAGLIPQQAEVWHEGKCGRCGRKLTVPESIERGLGPKCYNLSLG